LAFVGGGFWSLSNQPAIAQSQSFSSCVIQLQRGPYNSKQSAENCLNAFRGKPINENFSTCVEVLYRNPYSSQAANDYCQQAFNNAPNGNSFPNNDFEQQRPAMGGDPNAIATCMKKLMYDRQPVCTTGSCARLGSPEENANNSFGGWQWQTVRTNISEDGAARACRNAR
jgi:hypothetical protein